MKKLDVMDGLGARRRRRHAGKRTAAILCAGLFLAAASARAENPLEAGNQAFHAGDYQRAAELYEGEEEGGSLLTRKFNAGVSYLRAKAPEEAVKRFEDVSAKAEGRLRGDALYDAGWVRFQEARSLYGKTAETKDRDEKLKQLTEAARDYRAALEFFRQVEPPDDDADHNIAVSKTALRAVLDEIARIEEEKRKEAEDEALKNPPELLRKLVVKERTHRDMDRALAGQPGSKVRLGARRLRKSTADNRRLAEKLLHYLTAEPEAQQPAGTPPGTPAPQPSPGADKAEKERKERAAKAIEDATEALKSAEVAYQKLDVAAAIPHHTQAIDDFHKAMESFPINLPELVGDAIGIQEKVLSTIERIGRVERGGLAKEIKGSGAGKAIAEAIKDKVLMPLAKLISPERSGDARALADDEREVVWGAGIIAQAKIPPTPPPPKGASPGAAAQQPQLDAKQAEELSAAIRKEGQAARDAASKAQETLAAGHAQPAQVPATAALEALQRAEKLLPKPPESPEERLRKLIAKQREARQATTGLADLDKDLQKTAALQITTGQRSSGKEASGIAGELEKRQDERAKEAAPKVREGEREVYSSAEAIARNRAQQGVESIDRDIAAFEEALAILSGKKNQDKKKQQQQQKQNEKKQKQGSKPKPKQGRYALTPREARALQKEMDRQRREEEKKIFVAPSSMTVEKDW